MLDIGCGAGALLHRARDAGHAGRLCGFDPDEASLDRARRRSDVAQARPNDMAQARPNDMARARPNDMAQARPNDIEWEVGTAASPTWDGGFEAPPARLVSPR